MDRAQISFLLGMQILGIPVNIDNYKLIYNAAYLAEKRGVYLSPSEIFFDKKNKRVYSPKSHEDGGNPRWNLYNDISQIQMDIVNEDVFGWKLAPASETKLKQLKKDIETHGIERLLDSIV